MFEETLGLTFFPLPDVDMERERLYHDVFPTLSRLSNECGLQFHLVDMQHGLPLDEWRQRITLDIASREVALCQQLTVGPSIVVSDAVKKN